MVKIKRLEKRKKNESFNEVDIYFFKKVYMNITLQNNIMRI